MNEYIVFPMEYLNITQKYGVGSHVGTFAIDNAGRDTKIDNVFAPFSGVIKKVYKNGNTVWLESLNPVLFADGTVDYAVVSFTHDNDVNDIYVGQVIKQGVNFYNEGTAGNATGNHVHIEIGKGKYRGSGWNQIPVGQPGAGTWVINDKYKPELAFYLSGTEIINRGGLTWTTIGELMSRITKEQEMVLSQGTTGYNPGKDYNYQFTGKESTQEVLDALTAFWTGQAPVITKDMETAVAEGISGIKGYIGKDYNSQFVGQKVVSHYPEMVKFWIAQKPATPAPSDDYEPFVLPPLFTKKEDKK